MTMISTKWAKGLARTAIAATAFAIAAPAFAEELSVATFVPPQHHTNTFMFKWLGDQLEERSGGSLTLKVYPGGQLGAGPVQQYKRVVEGVADIVLGVASYTPELFPKTLLTVPPGAAKDSNDLTKRYIANWDKHFADEFKDVKFLGIGFPAGTSLSANRDMSTLEGMRGAKTVPYAASMAPMVEALGMVPVQMPVSDVYTGLSTGTIDAAVAAHNNMLAPWNWEEVSKFYIDNVPPQFQTVYVIMNKERYEGLSDEHRAIIDDLAGEKFAMIASSSFHNADVKALEAMKADADKSYEFITVTNDERAKMDAAVAEGMKKIFADYKSKGIDNAEEIYNDLNS